MLHRIGPINVCTDFEINRYKIDEVRKYAKIVFYLTSRDAKTLGHGDYDTVQRKQHSLNRRYTFHLSTLHEIFHQEKSKISRNWTTYKKWFAPSHDHSVSRFITVWTFIWSNSLDKTNCQQYHEALASSFKLIEHEGCTNHVSNILNLSNHQLSCHEIQVLSKGLNFFPTPKILKEDIANSTQQMCRKIKL